MTREELHHLVEAVPPERIEEAGRLLRGLTSPSARERDAMSQFLAAAPDDDEPYTEEEQQADVEAWARYRREGGIPRGRLRERLRGKAA